MALALFNVITFPHNIKYLFIATNDWESQKILRNLFKSCNLTLIENIVLNKKYHITGMIITLFCKRKKKL